MYVVRHVGIRVGIAIVDRLDTHREEVGLLIDAADRRFAAVAAAITLGAPVRAYVSGSLVALFCVHVALAAFWFGLDSFFKFVLGPALDESDPEAANAVNAALVPRMVVVVVVVAEPLSVGVVGSEIALAHRFGYWSDQGVGCGAPSGSGS